MKKIIFLALIGALTAGLFVSCNKDGDGYHIVKFDSRGGSVVASKRVDDGKLMVKPTDPTRDGFDFVEWARDTDGARPWNFATDKVNGSMTLYAQWETADGGDGDVTSWKNALSAAINAAEALPSYGYTYASYQALLAALGDAEDVAGDADATVPQMQTALQNLNAAIDALVDDNTQGDTGGNENNNGTGGTNKDALNTRIAYAEGLTQGDYTDASWNAFEADLANAEAVAGQSTASQAQINAALSQLNGGIAGLEHTVINDPTSDPNADKAALEQAIAAAGQLNEDDYTPESWTNLTNALTTAQQVDANDAATQTEVDAAYNDLQNSTNELVTNQNSALVTSLVDQLTNLVDQLPSVSEIENNPLLAATVTPVATLADGVRDQLNPLLEGTNNATVGALNNTLNGVLGALGLTNLI